MITNEKFESEQGSCDFSVSAEGYVWITRFQTAGDSVHGAARLWKQVHDHILTKWPGYDYKAYIDPTNAKLLAIFLLSEMWDLEFVSFKWLGVKELMEKAKTDEEAAHAET